MTNLEDAKLGRHVQARALERRRAILSAATELLVRDGMAAVTHRSVADLAGVPLSAIRYYYQSREALLVAAIDRIDTDRASAAATAITTAATGTVPVSLQDVGELVLQCCYGPRIDDAALKGTIGWVVDASRESSVLTQRLALLRPGIDMQLERLLSTCGYSNVPASLIIALLDGIVLNAVAEGKSAIKYIVAAEFAAALERLCDREHG